jgi:general secretion pathway protein K
MKRFLGNNRGMALILTILVVSLVVSLTLQLNASMRDDAVGAANVRDSIRLASVAKSGFDFALAVLLEDWLSDEEVDSVLDIWWPGGEEEILSAGSSALFSGSRLDVQIADHSGRIQINQLLNKEGKVDNKQRDLLIRFLTADEFDLDEDKARDVVAAIIDFIDEDGEIYTELGMGAEKDDYLDVGCTCQNGPIDFIEELACVLKVKGAPPELLGAVETLGVLNHLSPFGDGKINVNTAPDAVLMALSEDMTSEMVESMKTYREDETNDLSKVSLDDRLEGVSAAVDAELLTTTSSFFEVQSTASSGAMTRKVTGLVERTEEGFEIHRWKME